MNRREFGFSLACGLFLEGCESSPSTIPTTATTTGIGDPYKPKPGYFTSNDEVWPNGTMPPAPFMLTPPTDEAPRYKKTAVIRRINQYASGVTDNHRLARQFYSVEASMTSNFDPKDPNNDLKRKSYFSSGWRTRSSLGLYYESKGIALWLGNASGP